MGIELSDGLLAIVSHPDDETFGCGGTLALHRANNEDVRVLCLSCNPAERRREFMDATSELRVENRDIWDAEHISENAETIRAVADYIVEASPRTVITHLPFDYHREHRATFSIVKEAVEWAGHTTTYSDPCTVERLLLMEVNTLIPSPGVVVDVSEVIDQKKAAISRYPSQLDKFPWGYYQDYNLKKAELRGVQGGCGYGEAFLIEPTAVTSPFFTVKSTRDLLT